jgi:hypothetical protein
LKIATHQTGKHGEGSRRAHSDPLSGARRGEVRNRFAILHPSSSLFEAAPLTLSS